MDLHALQKIVAAAIKQFAAAIREVELQAQLLSLAVEILQTPAHRLRALGASLFSERLEFGLRHVLTPFSSFLGALLLLLLFFFESRFLRRIELRRMTQEVELHLVVHGHRKHSAVQCQLLNRRRLQIARNDVVGTRTKPAARHEEDRMPLGILPLKLLEAHLAEKIRVQLFDRHRAAQHRLILHRAVEDQGSAAAQEEKIGKNDDRGERKRRDHPSNYPFPMHPRAQHQARTFCKYALISSPSSIFMTSARISFACTEETARSFSLTRGIDGALMLSSVSPIAIRSTAA